MKKLKTIRKIVSLILCFAMTVSAFSMLAFAEEAGAEEAKEEIANAFTCVICGGSVQWFPGGDIVTSYTHPYFIYDSDGKAKERTCTVYVTTYYQNMVCTGCGALLAENSYEKGRVHQDCGA